MNPLNEGVESTEEVLEQLISDLMLWGQDFFGGKSIEEYFDALQRAEFGDIRNCSWVYDGCFPKYSQLMDLSDDVSLWDEKDEAEKRNIIDDCLKYRVRDLLSYGLEAVRPETEITKILSLPNEVESSFLVKLKGLGDGKRRLVTELGNICQGLGVKLEAFDPSFGDVVEKIDDLITRFEIYEEGLDYLIAIENGDEKNKLAGELLWEILKWEEWKSFYAGVGKFEADEKGCICFELLLNGRMFKEKSEEMPDLIEKRIGDRVVLRFHVIKDLAMAA